MATRALKLDYTSFTDAGGPFGSPWNDGPASNIAGDDDDTTYLGAIISDLSGDLIHEFTITSPARSDLIYTAAEVTYAISATSGPPIMSFQFEYSSGNFAQYAGWSGVTAKTNVIFSLRGFATIVPTSLANRAAKFRLVASQNGGGNTMSCQVYRVRIYCEPRLDLVVHE